MIVTIGCDILAVLGASGFLPGLERSAMAGIRYVDASANGANDGTSWPNAFNSRADRLRN